MCELFWMDRGKFGVFLSTLDTYANKSLPILASRSIDANYYESKDGTVENPRHYAFVDKNQAHILDNSIYGDVQIFVPEERKIWDEAMVKELKPLRDLGSFKMTARPRGANILQ